MRRDKRSYRAWWNFPLHSQYAPNDVAIRRRMRYIVVMPKTSSIAIRMDPEIREALKRAAEADGRSLSSMLAKIVADWIKTQETRK